MMIDTKLLKSEIMLRVCSIGEVVRKALASLDEPIDDLMLNLALCDESDQQCIERSLSEIYRRDGLQDWTIIDALRCYAKSVCGTIEGGATTPIQGAELIARVSMNYSPPGYHELDPFTYAWSEAEDRPEDKDFFEKAILKQVHKLLHEIVPSLSTGNGSLC